MTNQEQKQRKNQKKTYPSEYGDWPKTRPPLEVFLKQQDSRIKRVAARAMFLNPEYAEDMAQELRLKAVKAWETWDAERGPLSSYTWRHIIGSHLPYYRRYFTVPKGYRCSKRGEKDPKTMSLNVNVQGSDDVEYIDQLPGGYAIPENVISARQEVEHLLPEIMECIGDKIPMKVALERIAVLHGEIPDVAERQKISPQAVHNFRNRAIKLIRERLEVTCD